MFRGCPSGRMSHAFDKVTHRCKFCQRWQAGFAPKKVAVKPRNECQICGRQQALTVDGLLGHHGYKRPGWGFIQGDCYGVGHKPYPATTALVKWLAACQDHLSNLAKERESLATVLTMPYRFETGFRKDRKTVMVVVPRGQETTYQPVEGRTYGERIPSFDDLVTRHKHQLEIQMEHTEYEIKRVQKRIADAK